MLLLPSLRIGLETMRANPVRTCLSTLGIVMGAASLVGPQFECSAYAPS